MQLEFLIAGRILFGAGKLTQLGKVAKEYGQHVLVVSGASARAGALIEQVRQLVEREGGTLTPYSVSSEPTLELVDRGAELARSKNCAVVVGIGGGSVIDAAKAIAGLQTNAGQALDYVEVIGKGKPLARPATPCIAVPTTAGTGAEVTRNAVLTAPGSGFKVSMRSSLLMPAIALVDPELTSSQPANVSASTGLDALTQLIESFVSVRATPLTDALALEGIKRAARSLKRATIENAASAREDMALAALLSGITLTNAGLGAVHGFASPVGASYNMPHGAVCARFLPLVMAANVAALRERQPASPALHKYAMIAQTIREEYRQSGQEQDEDALIAEGITWIQDLCRDLHILGLAQYGATAADLPDLVQRANQTSSMKGNPLPLTLSELSSVAQAAL